MTINPNETFPATLARYMTSPLATSAFTDLTDADHADLAAIHAAATSAFNRDPDQAHELLTFAAVAICVAAVANRHKHRQFCPICFAVGLQDFVDAASALGAIVDGPADDSSTH